MSSLKLIEENIKAWMRFYEDPQDPSHIIIEWEDAYGGRPQKPVSRADYEAYRKGERSAYDIVFKAKNGSWPPQISQIEADRNFLKSMPELLVNDAANQKLFTRAELTSLLPEGCKILAHSDA